MFSPKEREREAYSVYGEREEAELPQDLEHSSSDAKGVQNQYGLSDALAPVRSAHIGACQEAPREKESSFFFTGNEAMRQTGKSYLYRFFLIILHFVFATLPNARSKNPNCTAHPKNGTKPRTK